MKRKDRWTATLDDVMHELEMATIHHESDSERHWMICAADDIAWYLMTDRASSEWYWALLRADTVKLLKRMVKAESKARDDQIQTATEYLRRYCGYRS